MFVVTVTFAIDPSRLADFRTAMVDQASDTLSREPSCAQFDVAYDPSDETVCFLYELYADRAAFEAHLISPHFKAFEAKVATWVVSKTVRTYERAWPQDGSSFVGNPL